MTFQQQGLRIVLRFRSHNICRTFATQICQPPEDQQHITQASRLYPLNGERPAYWQKVARYKDVTEREFLSFAWQVSESLESHVRNADNPKKARILDRQKFYTFLEESTPDVVQNGSGAVITREQLIDDVKDGQAMAPMTIRITPHVAAIIDWSSPYQCPVFRQFVPLKSLMRPDHPKLDLDSLGERADTKVSGLVHRYPSKVLMLTTVVCPVNCKFCTRSYAVGSDTQSVKKDRPQKGRRGWEAMLAYIEKNTKVEDVVVSGGDTFYLESEDLRSIGERLLAMQHIKRFRFASKALAVCPSRFLDSTDDWTRALIDLSSKGRSLGKEVALHTHFNHPLEISWVTRLAAQRLYAEGLKLRNQTVLLRGINDDVPTMRKLINDLANINVQPLYVYQGDMVKGVEDMRTPLAKAIHLESQIRGTISGHHMPSFVVDLPGGGGKRLVQSYESYDRKTGLSTFKAPGVKGDRIFHYYDPVSSHQ